MFIAVHMFILMSDKLDLLHQSYLQTLGKTGSESELQTTLIYRSANENADELVWNWQKYNLWVTNFDLGYGIQRLASNLRLERFSRFNFIPARWRSTATIPYRPMSFVTLENFGDFRKLLMTKFWGHLFYKVT